MIEADKGKPMTILEMISDEPCEPEPYIDYLLEHYRGHRKHWAAPGPDESDETQRTVECVLAKIDSFVMQLESIKRKMHRPTKGVR